MNFIKDRDKLDMKSEGAKTKPIDLFSPKYYINRELSLIEFNKRVLFEAMDKTHPLLERLKFATIWSSNLDEFFMIRVAGLKSQIAAGLFELSYDGMTPKEQLMEIRKRLLPLYELHEKTLKDDILPALNKEGIVLHRYVDLNEEDKEYLNEYFHSNILPALTPLNLGPANPFPRLINRSLNVAFVLNDTIKPEEDKKIGFLQLPSILPRFIPLATRPKYHYILLEQVIKTFAETLYPGMQIETTHTFRVTRDADIEIAEDEAEDLLSEIAEQVKHRRWGRAPVRLEVSAHMPEYLVELLTEALDLEPVDVYKVDRPLSLPDFMELVKLDLRRLKDKPFAARAIQQFKPEGPGVFTSLKQRDALVHHPYDSFTNSVLRFVNEAANDPDVVAIKITLYRAGMNSAIIAALKRAAENGKYVTAFVELKARFDEENNIIWAKELESEGVHVVYGVPGLKTHCKIAIVVRREANRLKTYVHLSTGNYNHVTARLYTDVGLFTANDEFGADAVDLFNYLTGYSYHKDWKRFIVAPIDFKEKLIALIQREAELHTEENPGLIIAKLNSIAHREVIPELYKASQKGVKIKLICRGICCLKPGTPGISENIEIRSILGRFLEHSRIFYFKSAGEEEIYLSSADWMSRNLHRRVEVMFPILDDNIKKSLKKLLDIYWKDNNKSWKLEHDGSYTKIKHGKDKPFSAQEYLFRAGI